jgi:hypothetical protein
MRFRVLLATLLMLPGACTTYDVVRMEFDSAAGLEDARVLGGVEPEEVRPMREVRRWPWIIRQLEGSGCDALLVALTGAQPRLLAVEAPGEFFRQRLTALVEMSLGERGRRQDAALRLLWVLARDSAALDQIVALDAAVEVLESYGCDPVRVPFGATDADVLRAAVEAAANPGMDPVATATGVEKIGELPSGRAVDARAVVRDLRARRDDLVDLEVGARWDAALDRVLCIELAQALRLKLASAEPRVREAAAIALHRLGGASSVLFLLRVRSSRPEGGRFEYDSDPDVRRTWVRLCGQLPSELAFASYEGGPQPAEFLYDVASGDQDAGLRMAALAALSQLLGRPVSLDPDWADAFFKERALGREVDATGGLRP